LTVLIAPVALGQTPTGSISGTITDPSKAVLPGAQITITEKATGKTVSLVSNDLGQYSVSLLLPGIYSVKVELPAFATEVLDNLVVSAGQVANGSVQLQVGRPEQTVEVIASSVQVDTVRQTVDTIINAAQISQLPLNGRNFLDLAALAPGVIIRDGESIDPTKATAYRTVGMLGRSGTGTRVQIDGIDVTDETVGTTTANISAEAVQEFQLSQSSLDLSTSLTSSGAVSIITKSGGNDIHGGAFYQFRNQDMGARLNFNPNVEPFHRHQAGYSVGGPFFKDKLFWSSTGERTWQESVNVLDVPEFPQLTTTTGFPVDIRLAHERLDWNVSPAVRLLYSFSHDQNLATGGNGASPFQNVDWTNVHTVGLDISKPHWTNSYRFGYVNFNNRIESQELKLKFPRTSFGLPYFLGVGPFGLGPNGLAPQATYQDNYQNKWDGSYVWRQHTFRYGIEVNRIILGGFANFAGPLSIGGTYDASTIEQVRKRGGNLQDPLEYPLEGFSTGPNSGFFTIAPAHNLPYGGKYNTRFAWYAGDSWKARRNLTFNFGTRWEYDSGYFNDESKIKRPAILDVWIKGASNTPKFPKNKFGPSFGFAWDPTSQGKMSIRGGAYLAYEMNIFNNLLFDQYQLIPPGIGPDSYDISSVTGPDGTPINIDGKHPDGNYEDLIGQPIRNVVDYIGQIHVALNNAYTNYKFNPSGKSLFEITNGGGALFGGMVPGDQFKIPYALQFNIGFQRELRPGTVLTVDYVRNHGIGLPFFLKDFERRRAASTLNVAAARARVNSVLGGLTVDQWLAANPTRTISAFGLISDSIYQGITPNAATPINFTRARFMAPGGFTLYQGLLVQLRGDLRHWGPITGGGYTVGYALSRSQVSAGVNRAEFLAGPLDNDNPNNHDTFGPNGLDRTSNLRIGSRLEVLGGIHLSSIWAFQTAPPITLTVPNLGGAISGTQGFFGTDINGDGGAGTTPRGDILPGMRLGQYGRSVKSFSELNKIIQAFNANYAGKLTPHGQALVAAGLFTEAQLRKLGAVIPTIPLIPEGNPNPFHNLFFTDLRISRPINVDKNHETWKLEPFFDVFNLFNHAPVGTYGGLTGRFGALNFDYQNAPAGRKATDLDEARGRITNTRLLQLGFRVHW
jgi:hypothetical protein